MKFLLCLALALSASCLASAATVCQEAHQDRRECMQASRPERPDREAKKAAFEACLTNSGCELPTPPEGAEDRKAAYEAAHQCMKDAKEELEDLILPCVQEQFADFEFLEHEGRRGGHRGGHRRGGHGGHGGRRGGGHRGGRGHGGRRGGRFLEKYCPSEEAVDAAQVCLEGLRPSEEEREARHAARQAARDQCDADFPIPEGCEEERDDVKEAVCSCSEEYEELISQKAEECFGDLGQGRRGGRRGGNPFCRRGRGGYGRHEGRGRHGGQ